MPLPRLVLAAVWLIAFSHFSANAAELRVPAQFPAIQAAIDSAKAGDTVLVAAGTYRERLKLKAAVTVRSDGDDANGKLGLRRAEKTILDGAGSEVAGVGMAEGAVLDGFTVTGVGKYDDALWQQHFDTQGNAQQHENIGEPGTPGIAVNSDCTVRNNVVHHIGYTGIAITCAKVSPRITGNVCYRNMGGGIGSMTGSAAIIEKNECFENFYAGIGCNASSPVIRDNFCHDNIRAGIGISEGSSPSVSGNRCIHNRRAGIGIRTGAGTRPTVEGNECRDNAMAGIGVEEGARPTLSRNKLINNGLVAVGIGGGSSAMIEGNEIVREGGAAPMIAVLDGSSSTIVGNTVRGGGVAGILVKGRAEIRDNQLIGSKAGNAIWAHEAAEVTLHGNRIEGWKQELSAAKGAKVSQAANDIAFAATNDGTEQRYAELLPAGFDEQLPHDALIALHGHGSDRWQFIRDTRGECKGVRDTAAKFGLIVVSPDYRAKTSWMGPKAEADVLQIIGDVKRRHHVNRVFIAGGSMGGTAALTFTALHPELIAGVCSLNGTANLVEYERFQDAISVSFGGSKSEAPDEYRKRSAELSPEKFTMPVALTTGGRDDVVPPQSVLRLAEKLTQAKHKVLSIHREGGGHATSYEDTVAAMEFVLREAGSITAEERATLLEAASRKSTSPDADIFTKGITWALRYDTALAPADMVGLKKVQERFTQRTAALESNQTPWTTKKGKVARGFVSGVDGSVQPYGVVIPKSYDGTKPMRLDVVLHGSSKPVGMSELKFIARFDEGDEEKSIAPDADYIELHPLGRVENCYRWAGETDVFEAVEAVCRNYKIDRDRIVLRGMSMGASGTWHLGLKHADRFVAIGPYCGYVDTHRFSETPIPGFIKVGPLPPHQELALHMLDSVDYAANASVAPAIAAIGDKDTFFQSHVHMGEAFAREGLRMVNLISPGTGHVIDPATHREQLRRIGEYAEKGLNHDPKHLRFVTWTLKYNHCHWLELLALGRHYERAEFKATVTEDDSIEVSDVENITRFAIHRAVTKLSISGANITLPQHKANDVLLFTRTGGAWQCDGPRGQNALTGKRPGLQGPIDDAFATSFLCVRGTGNPWNAEVNAWADASLRRFEYEWARYMRGDLPVKNDTDVTEEDVRTKHLILFGDPGSNMWIAKALPKLPVTWTHDIVKIGAESHAAKDHAPALICASPFASERYVVLNSGHTFHESEFVAFNYLLFPRLGDWAMMRVAPGTEEAVCAGFFDEQWQP